MDVSGTGTWDASQKACKASHKGGVVRAAASIRSSHRSLLIALTLTLTFGFAAFFAFSFLGAFSFFGAASFLTLPKLGKDGALAPGALAAFAAGAGLETAGPEEPPMIAPWPMMTARMAGAAPRKASAFRPTFSSPEDLARASVRA